MEFNWGDSIWELMLTKRPSDTRFSKSSTPGGESPLARDDDNTLNTHAVLFDGTKTALVILGTGVALGAAAMKAAPHVKSGLISLKGVQIFNPWLSARWFVGLVWVGWKSNGPCCQPS
jgi:hypothetical protein